eukprot:6181817-Pleurochrysis_carterae.AAC.7
MRRRVRACVGVRACEHTCGVRGASHPVLTTTPSAFISAIIRSMADTYPAGSPVVGSTIRRSGAE